ncbi:hypothetical protein CC86DRAFT_366681 [Ophiobolus disseminans]|uniref:Restriction of telomere capping protein 4 n=1 Tax=Ophiobolus disseminans TaxID=1469910 RepID=A0A6A7ADF9_9PLEO|nr:hypothetical protein CC86DRAFT_366681 [Ophiobolus disseminans]
MLGLRRDSSKLLRTVAGKEHASNEDHVEAAEERGSSPNLKITQAQRDVLAEPLSSDNELRSPPPRTTKSSKPQSPAKSSSRNSTNELRKPPTRSNKKKGAPRPPASGSYQRSQADKAKRGLADDKENDVSLQGSVQASQNNPWEFDSAALDDMASSQPKPKRQKMTFGSKSKVAPVTNIHRKPNTTTASKPAAVEHGKQAQAAGGSAKSSMDGKKSPKLLNDDEFDEMFGEGGKADPELPMPAARPSRSQKKQSDLELPMLSEKELDDYLGEPTPKPTRLQNQLGDWLKDQAPGSFQPNSSAPEEGLGNLDEYLGQLPKEEEEGSTCPICKEPVETDGYWEFWKGKAKTVKNQNTFCRAHRVKSAWVEYRSEGYPDIDWSRLPQRIRQHRMTLYKILNNERPSAYREHYKPIALTGKAATVPSRRKDLPEHVQEELESYALDDQSTYPGYYGPHGRRIVTEYVMKMLKNEIKNCTDAVVQGSGPATFIQAVLVPEMAILLIKEDCRVDREEAEDIREKTYEMGMLLNEEIEDQVEVHDQSDDENEYFGK